MNTQITTRHERTISEETKQSIEEEIANLGKFYDKISSVHVILDKVEHKSGAEDTAEILVSVDGNNLSANASAENMGKAFDAAMEKMTRQLKKKNEIEKSHK